MYEVIVPSTMYTEPDDGEPENSQRNEEQLQQRLVQLLNLPIHHVAPPQHHVTPSHGDTSSEGCVDSIQFDLSSSGPADSVQFESDSFLSLDCAALAKSLSGIPLHQMLGISSDLVQLCDMGAQTETIPTATPPEIDLSICTRKKEYTFGVPTEPFLLSEPSAADKESRPVRGVHEGAHIPTAPMSAPRKENMSSLKADEALDELVKGKRMALPRLPEESERDGGSNDSGKQGAADPTSRPKHEHSPQDEVLDRLLAALPERRGETSTGEGQLERGAGDGICSGTVHTVATRAALSACPMVEPTQHGGSGPTIEPGGLAQAAVNLAELDDMLDELLS